MIWNSKISTYYSKGRKAYGFGDPIPADIIKKMGKGTLAEYIDKGWILDGKAAAEAKAKIEVAEAKAKADTEAKIKAEAETKAEAERDALFEKAKDLGLKPNYRIGVPKLEAMIDDYEALQALKSEALALGIDPSDDVDFAELTDLVNEKKAENESDS